MYSGIFIFCGILVLVNTYPAVVYDYYNPNTRDVEDIEFRDNYQSSDLQSPCLRSHNGDVKCFFYNEVPENIPETPDYSLIPENPIELAGRQLDQDSIYEENNLVNPAAELLQHNPNYNVYNYESSPIRTYIHGLVPQHTSAYYGDVYPAVNPMPFNRLARRATSYEEFLAQLSHDAQMNNILPTMSFLRTAGPHYYAPYGSGSAPLQASFPQAVGGCSRPLLFGCSPIIYQGVMAHKGYAYPPAVQVLNPISYKESLRNQKVIRNKVKPPADKIKNDHREVLKEPVPEDFIAN
ncbi:uncharacterized protein LOC133521496 [Cydia pomonella]|uniref:uncharacterized protein LOC133521496 n=1 Tax=Cydia pomonella TaxID=82600 RepID=UPI002ADE1087|nr:uncharacterized protein LOC133521496 [Cydia pomonella]